MSTMHIRSDDVTERYELGECIGAGAAGEVFAATCKRTGQRVAIKRIIVEEEQQRDDVMQEASIMKALNHPNICKLFDVYESAANIHLVMEYLSGGCLLDRIEEEGSLHENVVQQIVQQVASALRHAHIHGVAHRDIKPENICFVDDDRSLPVVKLIDWGLAGHFRSMERECMLEEVGSCNYAAPEVLETAFGTRPSGYTCACDLWSLGAVTYEMICGGNPFWGNLDSMVNEAVQFEEEQWIGTSSQCKDFIKQLLRANTEDRLSMENLFHHDFFMSTRQGHVRLSKMLQELVKEEVSKSTFPWFTIIASSQIRSG